jgi:cell division protein FtsB
LGQALESLWNKGQAGLAGARSMTAVRARSRRLPSVIVVMVAVMLILGCLSCYRQTRAELNAAVAQRQAEAQRVDSLRIQALRLQAQIDRLKSDPKAIEALARENLGFVRPGEIVLRIRPDSNSSEGSIASAGSEREVQPSAATDSNPAPADLHSTGRADPPLASHLATAPYRR